MPLLNKLRKRKSGKSGDAVVKETSLKLVLVEILLFILLASSIGFYFNREDPLFLQNKYSLALHLLPISVITLYYGFIAGTMYMFIFSVILYLVYKNVEGLHLLYLFLFLLIFAEFHFYWNKVVQQNQERFEYVNDKLRQVARSLYVLKLSHDRLESYHISKPVSIRGFLVDVKKDLLANTPLEEVLRRTFNMVSNLYAIERGGVFEFDGKKFKKLASVGGMEALNPEDRLVTYAIEHEETAYIPRSAVKEEGAYLCFIPIYIDEGLKYAVVIEKMPFMNLNKDNMLAINLLFYYIILEYYELDAIRDIHADFGDIDVETIKEIYRCALIKKRYDVDSSLVLFTFEDWDESLYYLFLDKVRGLDHVTRYGENSLIVLLPLTNLSGAYQFLKRMEDVVREFKGMGYSELGASHRTYPIEDVRELLAKVCKPVQNVKDIGTEVKS
ncbi:MAG: PelD GGDEF domain-containing protein [Aquificaceae bacterium]|nr:PelD GGDEF domain-containing protein [Aquificaceae bacterium]